ncbi:porin family protein [Cognataquiflexum rubidum]|uniref:porin family protein n=1 Tax=Cognataquiflexum rubidum TaxID=2922273 RepID=UPI001F13BC20|nr:porin family protein [Cognataquiflexum rubidum]MCH6234406.1 PorT family protein [Cognataquiflexum rubidum]
MKKIMTIAILIFVFHSHKSFGQFGIQAGPVGVFGEAFPTADGLDKLGGALGFTFGAMYHVPLGDQFVIQPAMNFLNKKWSDELENLNTGDIEMTKMSINYLEIPVQFVFTGGKEKGFFAGLGPSFNMGLSGKRTVESNGNSTTTDYNFGSGSNEEAPFTIAVNAMVGYSFGAIQVGLNYSQGLTNQPAAGADQGNVNHLALRIGYVLR